MKKTPQEDLVSLAKENISDIVHLAIEHDTRKKILVIYDTESQLAQILFSTYQSLFPEANFMLFEETKKDSILSAINDMEEKDLVVLIQSHDFRLDKFRIRIHLFEKKIKVIDHMHLIRNSEESYITYINALSYDPQWYRGFGHQLKDTLSATSQLSIKCGEEELIVTGGLEEAKPNLGDYRQMKNIGGTFPIGEVFTEAKYLSQANGSLMIYAFADVNFNIVMHDPFRIDIKNGLVVSWGENAPQSFIAVVEKIKTNERPLMRELGFGLNRAITREHYLNDITAFERILGLHISLGEKHTVYKKEGITPKRTRFHVDIFLDADSVVADGKEIFKDGEYVM